jgi:hypothetical protein
LAVRTIRKKSANSIVGNSMGLPEATRRVISGVAARHGFSLPVRSDV